MTRKPAIRAVFDYFERMSSTMRVYNNVALKRRFSLFTLITFAFLWSLTPALSAPVLAHYSGALSRPTKHMPLLGLMRSQPPTYTDCQKAGFLCYSPQEMRTAYSLTPLINQGITGSGQTIVIIDSYGSPTAWQDLQTFDRDYGLPDPPSFSQLAPYGSVPFNPNNQDQVGWAEETSLDIQWSHAVAPGANILVLTTPVSETEGVQGLPQFLQLEQYALAHNYKIFSQSWAATENTLFTPAGYRVLNAFNSFYMQAVLGHHATFFASAGDSGSANVDANGKVYPFPTVGFPASSPWVTSVGGTSLYADINGNYQRETVWNDGSNDATGGGVSQYFRIPAYQSAALPGSDLALLKGYRGVPDIASNADPNTGVPVYLGFLAQGKNGYYVFGGTSESSPTWAGLLADASQYAGHPISLLNTKLYKLGQNPSVRAQVYHDVTVGNNNQPPIPGYSATVGWDPVTGWGSPIASQLFTALAH
ncbi:MAG TPA: S53 family peptidase [Ktedonobacteraceae bacterium]